MRGVLEEIHRFPIKGFRGQRLGEALIKKDAGLLGDRAFALAHRSMFADSPSVDIPWHEKKFFVQQNDWPDAYFENIQWHHDSFEMDLIDGKDTLTLDLNKQSDRTIFEQKITAHARHWKPHRSAKISEIGNLTLVGTPSSRFPDRFKNHISILSLASLKALNEALPFQTNLDVFRGNLILDDLNPWDEFSWLGKKIKIGQVTLQIEQPIVRCFNVEIHPLSRNQTIPVLATLAKMHRKAIFGVTANVVSEGTIKVGEKIEFSS